MGIVKATAWVTAMAWVQSLTQGLPQKGFFWGMAEKKKKKVFSGLTPRSLSQQVMGVVILHLSDLAGVRTHLGRPWPRPPSFLHILFYRIWLGSRKKASFSRVVNGQ